MLSYCSTPNKLNNELLNSIIWPLNSDYIHFIVKQPKQPCYLHKALNALEGLHSDVDCFNDFLKLFFRFLLFYREELHDVSSEVLLWCSKKK